MVVISPHRTRAGRRWFRDWVVGRWGRVEACNRSGGVGAKRGGRPVQAPVPVHVRDLAVPSNGFVRSWLQGWSVRGDRQAVDGVLLPLGRISGTPQRWRSEFWMGGGIQPMAIADALLGPQR